MSLYLILIIVLLVLLSAFFAGAEVALVSLSRVKVRTLVTQEVRGAKTLRRIKKKPNRMIIAILIGNNVVNVAASALATLLAIDLAGSSAVGIAAGLLTLFLLVFGEIIPKTYAQANASVYALAVAPIILLLMRVLLPLIVVLEWAATVTQRRFGRKDKAHMSEAEIKTVIELGVEHNILEPEEQVIINRAMRFSDTVVSQVMTPLQDVFALSADSTIDSATRQLVAKGFSRAPVCTNGDPQRVLGVAIMSGLMGAIHTGGGDSTIEDVIEKPLFVASELGIDDAFTKLQKEQMHLAVVRDRKKRIIGLITLEDIIEELVGEIDDEKARHRRDKKRLTARHD